MLGKGKVTLRRIIGAHRPHIACRDGSDADQRIVAGPLIGAGNMAPGVPL